MAVIKQITLQNNISELATLAAGIETFAEQVGLTMTMQFKLNLALDELVTNSIHHAYTDKDLHQIEIVLSCADSLLSVSVVDDGRPFDPTGVEMPVLASDIEQQRVGGLGIHFVRQLMDTMSYRRVDKQNHLLLEKQLSAADRGEGES